MKADTAAEKEWHGHLYADGWPARFDAQAPMLGRHPQACEFLDVAIFEGKSHADIHLLVAVSRL